MAKELVTDELWEIVEPLLLAEPPKPKGGRPRVTDRAALTGIIFVLKSGIPWGMLPQEMGCGSGSTCWRRLRDWEQAGVWGRRHSRECARARRVGRAGVGPVAPLDPRSRREGRQARTTAQAHSAPASLLRPKGASWRASSSLRGGTRDGVDSISGASISLTSASPNALLLPLRLTVYLTVVTIYRRSIPVQAGWSGKGLGMGIGW